MLFITIFIIKYSETCTVTTNSQEFDKYCSANFTCNVTFYNFQNYIENLWNCTKKSYRSHNRNYGYSGNSQSKKNYDLHITAFDLKNEPNWHSLEYIASHINTLIITNGFIEELPMVIKNNNFIKTDSLSITGNLLDSFNIDDIGRRFQSLKYLNFSNNVISTLINSNENYPFEANFSFQIIDLSNNKIEEIPDNFFSKCSELTILDISSNNIKRFSIMTFEGVLKLKVLNASNNKLLHLAFHLGRFQNLRELYINDNKLTTLNEAYFSGMHKLEYLNTSYNDLKDIEDGTFHDLISLITLNLSYNSITNISKALFENNKNLTNLYLSDNKIIFIEEDSFKMCNISTIQLERNSLTGKIKRDTFRGLGSVTILDLSRQNISVIDDYIFDNSQLKIFNLSCNLITSISQNTFHSLILLEKLDISYNLIEKIEFNDNLKNLKWLSLNNNRLKRIQNNTFESLTSLEYLYISNNKIKLIDAAAFKKLPNLYILILINNDLQTLESNTFRDLNSLSRLEISNTKISNIPNECFSGSRNLNTINASYSEIMNLNYNAFRTTDYIEILDFSHNFLTNFDINITHIINIKEIYLNNNNIKNISYYTFLNLSHLYLLDLSDNNILKIDIDSLGTLKSLQYLYLSKNLNLNLNTVIFENLNNISTITLSSNFRQYDFQHFNGSTSIITHLDISSNNIEILSSLYLFNIKTIEHINLSSNKISNVDKLSFRDLPHLKHLDLTNNLISTIQPGSFLHTKAITHLNLCNNDLSSLEYGVFDGMENLHILNISSNVLHSFSPNLLHNIISLTTLALDNNLINNIVITNFTKIQFLSLGGNPFSCDILIFYKQLNLTRPLVITQEKDFHSENINGISCKSHTKRNLISTNLTIEDQNSLSRNIDSLIESIQNLESTIKENYNKKISSAERPEEKTISKSLELIYSSINNTETYFKQSVNINNYTNSMIEKLINNINSKAIDKKILENTSAILNDKDLQDKIDKIFDMKKTKMFEELGKLYNNTIENRDSNVKTENVALHSNGNNENNNNMSGLIYFLLICVTVILILMTMAALYVFYYKSYRYNVSNNTTASTQGLIEMQ